MTFVICGKLNIAPFVHERSGAHFANTPQLCNLIQSIVDKSPFLKAEAPLHNCDGASLC